MLVPRRVVKVGGAFQLSNTRGEHEKMQIETTDH